jgi:dihydrofolate synthase/folylpolyglutamate synthase
MLCLLGDPHHTWTSIHVGGTNGKGTTAACVDAVLRAAGLRVGLYTSPHLVKFGERIRIGGSPAEPVLLEACAADVLPLAEMEDATFFESATVLAFECFRRAECEVVVAEVGLGGRLDATNVLNPSVTVITSVGRDHCNYLGDTLEEIAVEKAGILKSGVAAVVGDLSDGPWRVVEERATVLGVTIDRLGRDMEAVDVSVGLRGTAFTYIGPDGKSQAFRTGLIGSHQAANAALALRAVERFPIPIPVEARKQGLELVRWPGRFDVRRTSKGTWVLDLAHNTAAASTLAGLLDQLALPRPLVALIAILGDKPWTEMLEPLLGAVSTSVFTVAPSSPASRRWSPRSARKIVSGHEVEVEEDFDRALARARELAGRGTVVVTGSAHTVGDAMSRLQTQEV